MNELELDACTVETNGELVKLSLISTGQGESEGALGKLTVGRLASSMNQLGVLHTRRKISTGDTVVGKRIQRNDDGLASSRLNGSRA